MVLRRKPFVLAVALLALSCSAPAWAQSVQGKASGVVRDATGAGIPGATITATNQATNVSQATTTASDGTYALSVAPGAYRVTAALDGFRTATQMIEVPEWSMLRISLQGKRRLPSFFGALRTGDEATGGQGMGNSTRAPRGSGQALASAFS